MSEPQSLIPPNMITFSPTNEDIFDGDTRRIFEKVPLF